MALPSWTEAVEAAVSRRFKAQTEARLAEWTASDLSALDLLVIRIDGLHLDDSLLMIGAVGVGVDGGKHPPGQVCRNVKRWRDAKMALRWTTAVMLEAARGFRRLNAYRHCPP